MKSGAERHLPTTMLRRFLVNLLYTYKKTGLYLDHNVVRHKRQYDLITIYHNLQELALKAVAGKPFNGEFRQVTNFYGYGIKK